VNQTVFVFCGRSQFAAMRPVMRTHLLLTWLLWLQVCCRDVSSQTVCPRNEPRCVVNADSTMIFQMRCSGYGTLAQLPPACAEPRTISTLVVSRGTTTVDKLQHRILEGLRVRHLELAGLGIRSINLTAFEAVSSNLQDLQLHDNRLETLPLGVFRTMRHLVRLQLHNNRLSHLGDGVFSGLTSLVYLTLNGNRLTASTVDPDTWFSLPKLVTLVLDDNNLGDGALRLPNGAFESLEELRLDRNRLGAVNDDIISGLPNLRRLYLRSNEIDSLPNNAFRSNARLELVDLSANNISQLTGTPFAGKSYSQLTKPTTELQGICHMS